MAAIAALAAKQGKKSKTSLKGASLSMDKSMSAKQLKDFAKTKRKNYLLKRRLVRTKKEVNTSLNFRLLFFKKLAFTPIIKNRISYRRNQ